MAKIWGMEFVADDIKQLGHLLNSRIGLALLQGGIIWLVLQFIYPRLEEISKNTYLTASSLQETKRITESNHDMLTRMMDRCDISKNHRKSRDTTAAKAINNVSEITE